VLNSIFSLAQEAGLKILSIYEASSSHTQTKADGSPLTAADMAAHTTIVEGLRKITPDVPILSEESAKIQYDLRRKWNTYWLVDPLDGTKEFIKRNGEFTVNIALIKNGVPVMGVVHAPALGLSYFATQGSGAFKQEGNNKPALIHVTQHKPHDTLKIIGSRSHHDTRLDELIEQLGRCEFQSMGSSLKFCLVAEGKAHFYPRLGPTMEWDTAAAHCIVLEAGGVVINCNEETLHYNKPDLHNPPFAVLGADNLELMAKLRMCKW